MATITAVELGTDACAFARTSVRRGEVQLSAAEILDPAAFPGMDAFTIAVRQTRRSLGLPRRCRVVLWGLPDGANRKDAAVKPLLAPLTNAGFRVDRVVTPCNALAALARLKVSRGEGSTCWLGINRGGVAIVVVRPGKLLYAHSFIWDSQIGASGSQARLLQRYSLVSFLAPEVKRAIAEARKTGTPVDAVVTCGNLPDLRALTMPLMEELGVEVETLDSFEGLTVKPQVAAKLGDSAPAIRLACAAAIARGTRAWDPAKKRSTSRAISRYLAAAAVVLALLGVVYQWYGKPRNAPPPAFVVKAPAPSAKPPVVASAPSTPSVPSTNLPPKGGNYTGGTRAGAPALSDPAKEPESKGAVSVTAKNPESNPKNPESRGAPSVTAPAVKNSPAPPAVTKPPVVTAAPVPAKPTVSVTAKKYESNPPVAAPQVAKTTLPPSAVTKPPVVTAANSGPRTTGPSPLTLPMPNIPAPALSAPAPAVSATAKKPESNPPAVSVTAKAPESNPPAVSVTAKAPESNPKKPESTRPVITSAPALSVPAPAVSATAKKPESNPKEPESKGAVSVPAKKSESNPPAVSVPAKKSESNPAALNTPAVSADKPDARLPSPPGIEAPRGPAPPLLKDAVPRVTAILVSRDRRFATVDGGQIIAVGDLLGRRTVVAMDERSVVFQEPSGMQIRMGLGGRLLGIDRAGR